MTELVRIANALERIASALEGEPRAERVTAFRAAYDASRRA